jgi:hypothetical protein
MLRWRVELDVTQRNWKPEENLKGLNCAVEVHVKDGILIMPHPGIWPRYLGTDEEDPIVTRIGFDLADCRARTCPGLDSRLHSDRTTHRRKSEIWRAAADRKLTIREIVKHVALCRMRLAPGVFMRANVSGFTKISGSRISRRSQVSHVNQDPVRHAVMVVAGVVVGVRWESSGERIDPCAGANLVLVAVQT